MTGNSERLNCMVNRHPRYQCLVFVAALACMLLQLTSESYAQKANDEAIQKISAAVAYEVEHKDLPAFSIAIVEGNDVVWSKGFGFQDAEQETPATDQTVYRVGSISKLLTDISVMKLVESGELDLDEPVTTYLPDFKPNNTSGTPITLRMLMTHRSGLVRESPVGNYFDPDGPSLAATVASLNGTPIIYPPGSRTKYSNAAIAVVGAVLESKLKGRHADLVKREIFEPLQMDSSSFDLTPEIEKKLATAYMWTYDDRRFEAPKFLLGTGPAGNLYSSVLDLCKFTSFIFNEGRTKNGQVIKPATLKMMTSPQIGPDGKAQRFGIGFHIGDLDGEKVIGHGGAVYGFSTQLEAIPSRKIGVAAASALDGSNGVATRLSHYALRLMIANQDGKPLPDYQRTSPVAVQRAKQLVGRYREVDGDRTASIIELGGRTFLERGTFRHEIRANDSDGAMVTDDVLGFGMTVTQKNSDMLEINGTTFAPIANKPPAKVPDRWKGLIGEYGWDHNTLYILEREGQLYALIEWFYYYPLKEVNENEFLFPDYGLYHGEGLKFTRATDGTATEVVAAEVKFVRREIGTKDGETFKIDPIKPIEELRTTALAGSPPEEHGKFRNSDLVDLASLDPTIKMDIRYATTNNFMGAVFYKQPKAFMQRPAAEAVVRANAKLKKRGLGLLVHDAYRPWFVTKMFWDATPGEMKDFVANPALGSRHNRGCAVDITLYDLETGKPIQMVAGYDEFSARSFPMYPGGTASQRWYRHLLRQTMEAEGFSVYEFEWWHFDYKDWKKYRIGNQTFEDILSSRKPEKTISNKESTCRIAIGQIMCIDDDISGNLTRIEHAIKQAKDQQADIVCLPEMALRGWVNPEAHEFASTIPGKDSDVLCELARKYEIHVSIGLAEKEGDKLYDSAILIDDRGEVILKHRKINILSDLMKPSYTPGETVSVADTRFGKIGMLICADTFDQDALDKMVPRKPNLMLVPYGWANKAGAWPQHGLTLESTVSAAAKKLDCPVIGTNLVGSIAHGPWLGMVYGGQSYAVDAEGNTIATGADRDTDIVVFDVQL
ncbi:serine hydrolase [Mariniblastus fucicola]|uniref:D-alanyl-D-alanine dipeptidase n=1 Tax=Mariniblastus fucicola TaxID=980251 RepID=A0A5B9P5N5_9BACT|nr:serine hydrolase [Mariniblastus fucicola]QEG21887.1 D-alanyl-D-alanine dipeptidase [Mariniblastus fucicola]